MLEAGAAELWPGREQLRRMAELLGLHRRSPRVETFFGSPFFEKRPIILGPSRLTPAQRSPDVFALGRDLTGAQEDSCQQGIYDVIREVPPQPQSLGHQRCVQSDLTNRIRMIQIQTLCSKGRVKIADAVGIVANCWAHLRLFNPYIILKYIRIDQNPPMIFCQD